MHRILAATLALPLLIGAGAAMADQVTGAVEKVDPNSNTVWVNGQPWMLNQNAAGLKITEMKVGQKVTLEYDVNTNNVSNATPAK